VKLLLRATVRPAGIRAVISIVAFASFFPPMPTLRVKAEAFMGNTAGRAGAVLAMDVVFKLWWPDRLPVSWVDSEIAAKLNLPSRSHDHTEESVRLVAESAKTFFVEQSDGRLVPNPDYFDVDESPI
jgi:hypothetical protein